jgi:hypothetical protein
MPLFVSVFLWPLARRGERCKYSACCVSSSTSGACTCIVSGLPPVPSSISSGSSALGSDTAGVRGLCMPIDGDCMTFA